MSPDHPVSSLKEPKKRYHSMYRVHHISSCVGASVQSWAVRVFASFTRLHVFFWASCLSSDAQDILTCIQFGVGCLTFPLDLSPTKISRTSIFGLPFCIVHLLQSIQAVAKQAYWTACMKHSKGKCTRKSMPLPQTSNCSKDTVTVWF